MKKENLISTFQLIFALACWCTVFVIPANAQGDVTYEYRTDSVCAPADVWNKTHVEYLYWEVKVEKRLVDARPSTIYAMDTDGVNGIDTWTNDPEACARVKAKDCLELENSDETIIFEDRAGQDNVRLREAPKVHMQF